MLTYVEFISDKFPPYDDENLNPGVYGKRLAEFIATGLADKGITARELVAEDWGWMIPIENEEFDLWIGCGHYPEYENGFLCFIEPHQETLKKFLFFGKIDTTERVKAVQQALNELLTSELSVNSLKWSTHDEFNGLK